MTPIVRILREGFSMVIASEASLSPTGGLTKEQERVIVTAFSAGCVSTMRYLDEVDTVDENEVLNAAHQLVEEVITGKAQIIYDIRAKPPDLSGN